MTNDLPTTSGWFECEVTVGVPVNAAADETNVYWLDLWFNPDNGPLWWIGVSGKTRPLTDLLTQAVVRRWAQKPPTTRIRQIIQDYDPPSPDTCPDRGPLNEEEQKDWDEFEAEMEAEMGLPDRQVLVTTESLDFVRKFLDDYDNQNNRITAFPYYFVIQELVERQVPDGQGDETKYIDYEGDPDILTAGELVERYGAVAAKVHGDEWDQLDTDDQAEFINEQCLEVAGHVDTCELRSDWETPENHNVFFTEKAIDDHIAKNRYHWRGEVRTYVRYAGRNPEIEGIFKVLRELTT